MAQFFNNNIDNNQLRTLYTLSQLFRGFLPVERITLLLLPELTYRLNERRHVNTTTYAQTNLSLLQSITNQFVLSNQQLNAERGRFIDKYIQRLSRHLPGEYQNVIAPWTVINTAVRENIGLRAITDLLVGLNRTSAGVLQVDSIDTFIDTLANVLNNRLTIDLDSISMPFVLYSNELRQFVYNPLSIEGHDVPGEYITFNNLFFDISATLQGFYARDINNNYIFINEALDLNNIRQLLENNQLTGIYPVLNVNLIHKFSGRSIAVNTVLTTSQQDVRNVLRFAIEQQNRDIQTYQEARRAYLQEFISALRTGINNIDTTQVSGTQTLYNSLVRLLGNNSAILTQTIETFPHRLVKSTEYPDIQTELLLRLKNTITQLFKLSDTLVYDVQTDDLSNTANLIIDRFKLFFAGDENALTDLSSKLRILVPKQIATNNTLIDVVLSYQPDNGTLILNQLGNLLAYDQKINLLVSRVVDTLRTHTGNEDIDNELVRRLLVMSGVIVPIEHQLYAELETFINTIKANVLFKEHVNRPIAESINRTLYGQITNAINNIIQGNTQGSATSFETLLGNLRHIGATRQSKRYIGGYINTLLYNFTTTISNAVNQIDSLLNTAHKTHINFDTLNMYNLLTQLKTLLSGLATKHGELSDYFGQTLQVAYLFNNFMQNFGQDIQRLLADLNYDLQLPDLNNLFDNGVQNAQLPTAGVHRIVRLLTGIDVDLNDIISVNQATAELRNILGGLEKGGQQFLHPLTQRYRYLAQGGFDLETASVDLLQNVLHTTIGDRVRVIENIILLVNQPALGNALYNLRDIIAGNLYTTMDMQQYVDLVYTSIMSVITQYDLNIAADVDNDIRLALQLFATGKVIISSDQMTNILRQLRAQLDSMHIGLNPVEIVKLTMSLLFGLHGSPESATGVDLFKLVFGFSKEDSVAEFIMSSTERQDTQVLFAQLGGLLLTVTRILLNGLTNEVPNLQGLLQQLGEQAQKYSVMYATDPRNLLSIFTHQLTQQALYSRLTNLLRTVGTNPLAYFQLLAERGSGTYTLMSQILQSLFTRLIDRQLSSEPDAGGFNLTEYLQSLTTDKPKYSKKLGKKAYKRIKLQRQRLRNIQQLYAFQRLARLLGSGSLDLQRLADSEQYLAKTAQSAAGSSLLTYQQLLTVGNLVGGNTGNIASNPLFALFLFESPKLREEFVRNVYSRFGFKYNYSYLRDLIRTHLPRTSQLLFSLDNTAAAVLRHIAQLRAGNSINQIDFNEIVNQIRNIIQTNLPGIDSNTHLLSALLTLILDNIFGSYKAAISNVTLGDMPLIIRTERLGKTIETLNALPDGATPDSLRNMPTYVVFNKKGTGAGLVYRTELFNNYMAQLRVDIQNYGRALLQARPYETLIVEQYRQLLQQLDTANLTRNAQAVGGVIRANRRILSAVTPVVNDIGVERLTGIHIHDIARLAEFYYSNTNKQLFGRYSAEMNESVGHLLQQIAATIGTSRLRQPFETVAGNADLKLPLVDVLSAQSILDFFIPIGRRSKLTRSDVENVLRRTFGYSDDEIDNLFRTLTEFLQRRHGGDQVTNEMVLNFVKNVYFVNPLRYAFDWTLYTRYGIITPVLGFVANQQPNISNKQLVNVILAALQYGDQSFTDTLNRTLQQMFDQQSQNIYFGLLRTQQVLDPFRLGTLDPNDLLRTLTDNVIQGAAQLRNLNDIRSTNVKQTLDFVSVISNILNQHGIHIEADAIEQIFGIETGFDRNRLNELFATLALFKLFAGDVISGDRPITSLDLVYKLYKQQLNSVLDISRYIAIAHNFVQNTLQSGNNNRQVNVGNYVHIRYADPTQLPRTQANEPIFREIENLVQRDINRLMPIITVYLRRNNFDQQTLDDYLVVVREALHGFYLSYAAGTEEAVQNATNQLANIFSPLRDLYIAELSDVVTRVQDSYYYIYKTLSSVLGQKTLRSLLKDVVGYDLLKYNGLASTVNRLTYVGKKKMDSAAVDMIYDILRVVRGQNPIIDIRNGGAVREYALKIADIFGLSIDSDLIRGILEASERYERFVQQNNGNGADYRPETDSQVRTALRLIWRSMKRRISQDEVTQISFINTFNDFVRMQVLHNTLTLHIISTLLDNTIALPRAIGLPGQPTQFEGAGNVRRELLRRIAEDVLGHQIQITDEQQIFSILTNALLEKFKAWNVLSDVAAVQTFDPTNARRLMSYMLYGVTDILNQNIDVLRPIDEQLERTIMDILQVNSRAELVNELNVIYNNQTPDILRAISLNYVLESITGIPIVGENIGEAGSIDFVSFFNAVVTNLQNMSNASKLQGASDKAQLNKFKLWQWNYSVKLLGRTLENLGTDPELANLLVRLEYLEEVLKRAGSSFQFIILPTFEGSPSTGVSVVLNVFEETSNKKKKTTRLERLVRYYKSQATDANTRLRNVFNLHVVTNDIRQTLQNAENVFGPLFVIRKIGNNALFNFSPRIGEIARVFNRYLGSEAIPDEGTILDMVNYIRQNNLVDQAVLYLQLQLLDLLSTTSERGYLAVQDVGKAFVYGYLLDMLQIADQAELNQRARVLLNLLTSTYSDLGINISFGQTQTFGSMLIENIGQTIIDQNGNEILANDERLAVLFLPNLYQKFNLLFMQDTDRLAQFADELQVALFGGQLDADSVVRRTFNDLGTILVNYNLLSHLVSGMENYDIYDLHVLDVLGNVRQTLTNLLADSLRTMYQNKFNALFLALVDTLYKQAMANALLVNDNIGSLLLQYTPTPLQQDISEAISNLFINTLENILRGMEGLLENEQLNVLRNTFADIDAARRFIYNSVQAFQYLVLSFGVDEFAKSGQFNEWLQLVARLSLGTLEQAELQLLQSITPHFDTILTYIGQLRQLLLEHGNRRLAQRLSQRLQEFIEVLLQTDINDPENMLRPIELLFRVLLELDVILRYYNVRSPFKYSVELSNQIIGQQLFLNQLIITPYIRYLQRLSGKLRDVETIANTIVQQASGVYSYDNLQQIISQSIDVIEPSRDLLTLEHFSGALNEVKRVDKSMFYQYMIDRFIQESFDKEDEYYINAVTPIGIEYIRAKKIDDNTYEYYKGLWTPSDLPFDVGLTFSNEELNVFTQYAEQFSQGEVRLTDNELEVAQNIIARQRELLALAHELDELLASADTAALSREGILSRVRQIMQNTVRAIGDIFGIGRDTITGTQALAGQARPPVATNIKQTGIDQEQVEKTARLLDVPTIGDAVREYSRAALDYISRHKVGVGIAGLSIVALALIGLSVRAMHQRSIDSYRAIISYNEYKELPPVIDPVHNYILIRDMYYYRQQQQRQYSIGTL